MTIFRTECRVRYVETDCAGIVHYAFFFHYFEVGRMEMWRELGLPSKVTLPVMRGDVVRVRTPSGGGWGAR